MSVAYSGQVKSPGAYLKKQMQRWLPDPNAKKIPGHVILCILIIHNKPFTLPPKRKNNGWQKNSANPSQNFSFTKKTGVMLRAEISERTVIDPRSEENRR